MSSKTSTLHNFLAQNFTQSHITSDTPPATPKDNPLSTPSHRDTPLATPCCSDTPSDALGDTMPSSSSSGSSSVVSTPYSSQPASPASPVGIGEATLPNVLALQEPPLPELFIFDKDGTLICFHAMWRPWLDGLVQRIEASTGFPFADSLLSMFGFDRKRDKFEAGLLAEGTMEQCRAATQQLLAASLGEEKAEKVVASCWSDCDTSSPENLRVTCDVVRLLTSLKSRGVKVAMCTSDSRVGACGAVDQLGVAHLFDVIVAGGDAGSKPKPDPHNALMICRKLGVAPDNAVMVGDTRADTEMGKSAGLGLTVGVLSGIGNQSDLIKADVILKSVEQLFKLYPSLN